MHLLHVWTKWNPYEFVARLGATIQLVELREIRRCEICGKTQDKLITEHPFDIEAISVNNCYTDYDLKGLKINEDRT